MQEIPVSVTAFSASEIQVRRIDNVQKISESTPNLWMETNTGMSSGSRAALRGIGEDESFFTSDTPVGIYVDDMYIPRQGGAMFDLFELERLEVLRGPQGTLYGRNTSAGAIRFVTQKPGNESHVNLEGVLGEYSQRDFRGSLNAPLGEKAAFQIAGMVRKHDGYGIDKANSGRSGGDRDVNDQDIWGLRASLSLSPSDRVNILLIADVLRERSTPGFGTAFVDQPPLNSGGFGVGYWDLSQDLDGDGDPRTMESDLEEWLNDLDQTGFSGTLTWQMNDKMTFKSITGFRKMDHLLLLDADGRNGNFIGFPAPTFHLYQDQAQKQWSQEFQVQGIAGTDNQISYIAGFFYFHEENVQRTENFIFAPHGGNNFWDSSLDTDSYAGFASVTFGVGEKVDITAGARYTKDTKEYESQVFAPGGFPYPTSPTPVVDDGTLRATHLKPSWDAFTPRFAIDYKANENVLLYGSASRGYKSGAFDGRTNSAALATLEPILPETLWSYELGIKSDSFNNRFRLNIAAFLNDWKDLQGSGTDPAGNFKRFSLGDVETKGLEFEAKAILAEGLELNGILAFLDTRYKKQNFNQAVDCAPDNTGDIDLALKFSPKNSYRLGFTYMTPEAAGGHFSFGSSVSHKDSYFNKSCNAIGGSEDGWTLVDAFLAYETNDGRWRIGVNGENLTDEEYVAGSFLIQGLRMAVAFLNPPRRFLASVRFSY